MSLNSIDYIRDVIDTLEDAKDYFEVADYKNALN
jgi:hypothetical protein